MWVDKETELPEEVLLRDMLSRSTKPNSSTYIVSYGFVSHQDISYIFLYTTIHEIARSPAPCLTKHYQNLTFFWYQ